MTGRLRFDPRTVAVEASPSLPAAIGAAGRPLHIEIGFGKDVRLLRAAAADPGGLHLGVEISRKKFESFCRKVAREGLGNVRAFHGDARALLAQMLPPGSVASFTILFPDPWPKRRHWKNRWIDASTALLLARALSPGGEIEVATDHAGYMADIAAHFRAAGLELGGESASLPEGERTIFAQRFERLGAPVIWQRWTKPGGRGPGSGSSGPA
jgi:tRNA (guanine-N7-)-methyltransferase